MGVQESDPLAHLRLPPGFRFYPTDEELLVQYLCRKVAGQPFSLQIIGDIDLYKFDPWDLPSKAMFGEKEWYFFSPRDRKYPNGSRPNRVAGSGYWKATGTDKIITTEGRRVGIKKALVFYVGKAPKGTKTNWIMHEYRLLDSTRKSGSSKLDDWVLCRIYKKNSGGQKFTPTSMSTKENSTNGSFSSPSTSSQTDHIDDVMHSFPQIDDRFFALPRVNSLKKMPYDDRANVNNQLMGSASLDWATLAGLNSLPEPSSVQPNQQGFFGYNNNAVANDPSSIPPTLNTNRVGLVEEEVQSGLRTQGVSNPGPTDYYQSNQVDLAQNFSNSFEPYGLRFTTQPGSGYGFRQ